MNSKMKFFTAAAAALFLSFGAWAQNPADVSNKFNEAAELVNNKQYGEAIPVLNEVVSMGLDAGPEAMETVNAAQKLLPACYFRVGLEQAKANQNEQALETLAKAAELGELYNDATNMRNANTLIGQLYTKMAADAFNNKDYAKAAEIFAKGYEANPTDTKIGLNLAMSYYEMGDVENGRRVYEEIIALGEKHSKYKEAADEAKEKLAEYMLYDASNAIKEQNYDTAFAMIDQLLEADPENALGNMMLIQTANNLKRYDTVIERGEAAAAAQKTPELQSEAYFLLGIAYQNKDNKAKAIENFRKVTAGGNAATARAQIAELSK